MLSLERQFWDLGFPRVAGVDEVGRGPLAGPVVACAVILEPAFAQREEHELLNGLTDSKKLSPIRREGFFDLLVNSAHVEIGIGSATVEEIDHLNILKATVLAMARAILDLPSLPQHVLVDGLPVAGLPCASTAVVGGDSKSLSVAAASVVAKVLRDGCMKQQDHRYPQYGFARHKGYGSKEHVEALFEFGPSPLHRRSFGPVREAEEIRRRVSLLDRRPYGDKTGRLAGR